MARINSNLFFRRTLLKSTALVLGLSTGLFVPVNPTGSDSDSFLLSAHSKLLPSRRRLGKRKMRRRT